MDKILNMIPDDIDYMARFMGISEDTIEYGDIPPYHKDINRVYQVENKLKKENLITEYVSNLEKVLKLEPESTHSYSDEYKLIHASAWDRCRAILMTLKNNY